MDFVGRLSSTRGLQTKRKKSAVNRKKRKRRVRLERKEVRKREEERKSAQRIKLRRKVTHVESNSVQFTRFVEDERCEIVKREKKNK